MLLKSILILICFSGLTAMAQNPAGPQGGNEPPPTAPALGKESETPVTPNPEKKIEIPKHRFGVFGGVNFPHILTYGIEYRHASRKWGFNLTGGGYDASFPDAHAKITNQELNIQWFPWETAFYVGLGVGKHEVVASQNQTVMGENIRVQADVKANYITPQVGWHWENSFGLTWGFEVGYLSPSGATTDVNPGTNNPLILNDPSYLKTKKETEDQGKTLGNTGLPYVTLFRLGYQF